MKRIGVSRRRYFSLTGLILISIININDAMILCLCQGVSDRVVRLAVVNGADSVDAVGDHCGAGTDCGSCQHAIEEIVEEFRLGGESGQMELGPYRRRDPAAPLHCGRGDSSASTSPSPVAASA
jgi:bacterioferritin-associated ferredoxin